VGGKEHVNEEDQGTKPWIESRREITEPAPRAKQGYCVTCQERLGNDTFAVDRPLRLAG